MIPVMIPPIDKIKKAAQTTALQLNYVYNMIFARLSIFFDRGGENKGKLERETDCACGRGMFLDFCL